MDESKKENLLSDKEQLGNELDGSSVYLNSSTETKTAVVATSSTFSLYATGLAAALAATPIGASITAVAGIGIAATTAVAVFKGDNEKFMDVATRESITKNKSLINKIGHYVASGTQGEITEAINNNEHLSPPNREFLTKAVELASKMQAQDPANWERDWKEFQDSLNENFDKALSENPVEQFKDAAVKLNFKCASLGIECSDDILDFGKGKVHIDKENRLAIYKKSIIKETKSSINKIAGYVTSDNQERFIQSITESDKLTPAAKEFVITATKLASKIKEENPYDWHESWKEVKSELDGSLTKALGENSEEHLKQATLMLASYSAINGIKHSDNMYNLGDITDPEAEKTRSEGDNFGEIKKNKGEQKFASRHERGGTYQPPQPQSR